MDCEKAIDYSFPIPPTSEIYGESYRLLSKSINILPNFKLLKLSEPEWHENAKGETSNTNDCCNSDNTNGVCAETAKISKPISIKAEDILNYTQLSQARSSRSTSNTIKEAIPTITDRSYTKFTINTCSVPKLCDRCYYFKCVC